MQIVDIGSAFLSYLSMFIECMGYFFLRLSSIRILGASLLSISVTFLIIGLLISVFIVVNRAQTIDKFTGSSERKKKKDD